MTAMHLQHHSCDPDGEWSARPQVHEEHPVTPCGPDDYHALVETVCVHAMRTSRSCLELLEAINRIDALDGDR